MFVLLTHSLNTSTVPYLHNSPDVVPGGMDVGRHAGRDIHGEGEIQQATVMACQRGLRDALCGLCVHPAHCQSVLEQLRQLLSAGLCPAISEFGIGKSEMFSWLLGNLA